jgi:predicted transcriptional regulator
MQTDWENSEQLDKIIEQLAAEVCRRGMSAPAIFFLEMNKPLATMFHQAAQLTVSMVAPFVGPHFGERFLKLIETRENIEKLIAKIEQVQSAQD